MKNKKLSETRKRLFAEGKIQPYWQGKKMSQETRLKMRESGKRKKFTREHRKNIGQSIAGEKHWNWKGGISYRSPKSLQYKEWREAVLQRDNHHCIVCGSQENLHADHIKSYKEYPALRFDIHNGRTLCAPCHRKTFVFMGNQFVAI